MYDTISLMDHHQRMKILKKTDNFFSKTGDLHLSDLKKHLKDFQQ